MLLQPCQERGNVARPIRKNCREIWPFGGSARRAAEAPKRPSRGALRVGLNCGLRSAKAPFVALSPSARSFAGKRCRAMRESGLAAQISACRVVEGRNGRSEHANAGAHAIDPIGRSGPCFRGGARSGRHRVRRTRPAEPLANGLPAVGRADHGRHHLVPRFRALDHRGDHGIRAGAALDRDREVQRQGQPGAVAHHPQHAARSGSGP